MPAKEIKELRQAGKLADAYAMAKAELEVDLSNIWGKRNLSWVLYAQLDELASNLDAFIEKINEVKELDLPASEEMFFENISIVISKAARVITHEATLDINKIHRLFDSIKELSLKRNSKWFSVLFNAMHKGMKESNRYIEFADWWDFKNFRTEDFQKEKLPNGKEVMAIAEQAYIAYAKHLLPKQTQFGENVFDKEKVVAFMPTLSDVVDTYPQFQYPAYFYAKLLLALGDKTQMLSTLLPFAKKKRSDFWVWDLLAEALSDNAEIVFACYCKALSCKSPEEMLVSLRKRMARILISRKLYNEARTEIDLLVHARTAQGFKIPTEVTIWQTTDWYKTAVQYKSNLDFYKTYIPIAEALLFNDVPEESVIVEFVNTDKKVLNFIASESKFGFFKYERFLSKVEIGDVLKVRFQSGTNGSSFMVLTAVKTNDNNFADKFIKDVKGVFKIPEGKSFGFIDDYYVHPKLIIKYNLTSNIEIFAKVIRHYNPSKKTWDWRVLKINT
jgi:hypothetical protein